MPVQLDIAGNFAAGQRTRRNRQFEKAMDFELGQDEEQRRGRYEVLAGEDPEFAGEYQDLQEHGNPWLQNMFKKWRARRGARATPQNPAGLFNEESLQTAQFAGQQQASAQLEAGAAPPTNKPPEEEEIGMAHGGMAIPRGRRTPSTSPGRGYQSGGLVGIHLPRRRAIASAGTVQQRYQDGGYIAANANAPSLMPMAEPNPALGGHFPQPSGVTPGYQDGGVVAEELAARNAANRAAYEGRAAERALSPSQVAERGQGQGRLARYGRGARTALKGAARYGAAGAAIGTIAEVNPFEDYGGSPYTSTEEYRERMGLQPSRREGIPRLLEDAAIRTGGVLGDIGNRITGGLAGEYGESLAEPPAADSTAAPPTAIPGEPDTVEQGLVAQSIDRGQDQAEQAKLENAPPGDIDFSQEDFTVEDIPEMTTRDWVDYRQRVVRGLILQGSTPQEAHDSVTQTQQQGVVNYLSQARMHLGSGDNRSAILSLTAAYQHFPNGKQVRFGTAQDRDGNPVILSQNLDEESGEAIGQPMLINEERLAALSANFEDPTNFLAWTKDWRDESFKEREYQEVTRPEAESQAQLRGAQGQYYLDTGQARLLNELIQDPMDVEENAKVFREVIAETMVEGVTPQDIRSLTDLASRIRASSPNMSNPTNDEIINLLMIGFETGDIEGLKEQYGVR